MKAVLKDEGAASEGTMPEIHALKAMLEENFAAQALATQEWHASEPSFEAAFPLKDAPSALFALHARNFQLWHVEDRARRRDVADAVIAACKREIDALNQARNDCIEVLDRQLVAALRPLLPQKAALRVNTETLGMAADRLSILALKVYHMEEQTLRRDVGREHIDACREKLAVLRRQRLALTTAALELLDDYAAGIKTPVLYSQFKMYNDPNLNPEVYGHDQG